MLTQQSIQIDAVFGIGAGVAEMLLQSHDDCIEYIHSIPYSWISGQFKGFMARGGFEVACGWSKGKITSAQIKSIHGSPCALRLDAEFIIMNNGAPVPIILDEHNRSCFNTRAGETYDVEII
ncbi:MAG: hypothetical protein E4H27_03695 [Anaerolineales bacterium]|nr:MAG: hypothetical protein E4H27_03695 [Anaerolineales bacterium]